MLIGRHQTAAPTIPFLPYNAEPPAGLTPSHISFLAPYLAPPYLTTPTLERLSQQFVAASEIALHNFLHPDLAAKIKTETEATDTGDYDRPGLPEQDLGEGDGWSIHGPPSKHRYLSLSSTAPSTATASLQTILNTLLPSEAFRAWLSVVSSLAPTGYRAEARRFRRGLDYTLAAGEEKSGEARLDVWLGATWWADVPAGSDEEDVLAEHGGWDCYLAAPAETEDPAVYQSSVAKKALRDEAETTNGNAEWSKSEQGATDGNGRGSGELEMDPSQLSSSDFDSDSDDNDIDEPLLTQPASFNKLLLVLRDPGVMRFVKYLSAGARGSRWDVGGEWEVGVIEEADEDGNLGPGT